ncbi:MAG: LacI family transcriptional regulator [Opitutaceae bacterium]|nr:LacI family transcriptional regulator [Opitutaceae bacterium]
MKVATLSPVARPRLRDVAEKADVSIGTVSRVLNGKADVAEELAERVLLAARSLGYTRRALAVQPVAQTLRQASNDTAMIGYLVDAPSLARVTADPFLQHFLAGIEDGVNRNNGHLLFATCGEEVARGAIPAMIAENRVQGVILKPSSATPDAWIRKLNELVPVVMLMNSSEDRSISSVMCDNYAATYQILRYLRELGHRRIAFLSVDDLGQSPSVLHSERMDAYRKYAGSLGCVENPAYLQTPTRDHARETLAEVIETGLKNLLAIRKAERPTAVVCATDSYAFALLALAGRHGIGVPGDLSVVGYMNTDTCEHSAPPLTSVSLSGDEVGRVAVNLLYERLQNPSMMVRHVSVGTRLVERLSCAPAPDS